MIPARTEPRGRVTHALVAADRRRAICGALPRRGWHLLAACEVQCARCAQELELRPLRQAKRAAAMEARREAARLASLDKRTLPLFPELGQPGG
jgi:hypothetical protein